MGTVAMKKTRRVERYSGERVEQDARDMRLGQRMHTRASRAAACSSRPLVGKSFSKASPSSSPPSWRWPYISALLREKTTQISQRGQGKFNQGSERDRANVCAVCSSLLPPPSPSSLSNPFLSNHFVLESVIVACCRPLQVAQQETGRSFIFCSRIGLGFSVLIL